MKKLLLFLSIIALLSLGACSLFDKESEETETAGITDNEILIGSSAALGGHASFLGTQTIHGSMAYIKEVNESGGVNGRQIRLISYDDQYDPPKTVANTQKLISQDGVFALFDYVGTPTSVKIIDMVHEAKIPLLGLFTGAEDLRTPFRPYIFNVRDSYYSEAEGAIDHFVNKLGKKKIAVLYQEDAFGKAVLSGIQISLDKRGLKPVATDTYVRGTMDVEDALTNIKKSNADVVIMVGTYTPLAKFIELSHQSKFKPYFHTVSFIGSEAYGTEIIKREGIDKNEYKKIIVTQVVPSPNSEEYATVREYKKLLKKHFPQDTPNYVSLEGFINAKVLVKALKDSGKDITREKFITELENMNNIDLGIGKSLSYSTSNHQGLRGIYYSSLSPDGIFHIFSN